MFLRPNTVAAWLVPAALALLTPNSPASTAPDLRLVTGSVRTPDPGGQTMGRARIVRALTPDELAAPMAFSVSLSMRDFDGLQARIAAGELVSAAEMEATYLPLRADYDRLADWLTSQGFTRTLADRVHTTVFVNGTVSGIARVFGVQFARVAVSDGEYTSAISEPSIPAELAPVVLSVNELQPEFRLRHIKAAPLPVPADLLDGFIYVTPDNVTSAYNIPAGATGAGQVIAIVGEAAIPFSDLSTFWSKTGVSQVAGNVTEINVNGGPSPVPSDSLIFETDLDVEWAGAVAPGARIRLYLSTNALENFTQISNDLPGFPTMSVISSSYGNTEGNDGTGTLRMYSQVTATLAAAGVSILSSSGDAGSNPNPNSGISAGGYQASAPLDVTYPASDPDVTGVGGSTVTFTGNWAYGGEVVWNQIVDPNNPSGANDSASGGGVSSFFAKPSWQTGGSVLAGQTMRCVPDVAAIADSDLSSVNVGQGFEPSTASDVGVLIYDSADGSGDKGDTGASGTSLACPIWAAVAALINQARAANGMGPIGLLNPHLYTLAGTSAFHDITSGNNGNYTAGPGYDLCTGLGSPNVANLITALAGPSVPQRLVNISARAEVETGANIVIAGFVVQGPASTSKDVLVRGIGPALTAFSVAGALASPVVSVYDSSMTLIASDTGWSNAPMAGSSSVGATFREATATDMAQTGAFALTAGSADSAMVLTLPVGNYTVQVSGLNSTSGVALAEVYELSTTVPEVLENISARSFVGTGSQVAISGFVVQGNKPAELLIRGVGPGLGAFGVSGTLAQPMLSLFDSSTTLIASDTGWGNAPVAGTSGVAASYRKATAADMSAVGAFSLTAGSADSAIVVTLPPGSYTAEVSGVGSTTGVALAEVYEIASP
jgi:kumamolisin